MAYLFNHKKGGEKEKKKEGGGRGREILLVLEFLPRQGKQSTNKDTLKLPPLFLLTEYFN